jgi:hypothetical protein
MARLQVLPPPTMCARDFFYHADMIQKDIVEEEKAREKRQQRQRRQQQVNSRI